MVQILEWLKNKPIYRKLLFGFLVILGIYLLATLAVIGESIYKNYKEKKAIQKWEEALRKPYKEDIYGGKTPEETWQMFLDALKKGDIELASKYFVVEKQGEYRQLLIDEKNNKTLESLVTDYSQRLIKEETPIPRNDKDYYYITRNLKGEKINDSIIFYLNPITKVWKILTL